MVSQSHGRDIIPLHDREGRPRPTSYTLAVDCGVAVQVRNWREDPRPRCDLCEICNVARTQDGTFQCVRVAELRSGFSLPRA